MHRWAFRISPRRAAFGGTICLILGVVTTVGAAWTFSSVNAPTTPLFSGDDLDIDMIDQWMSKHGLEDSVVVDEYEWIQLVLAYRSSGACASYTRFSSVGICVSVITETAESKVGMRVEAGWPRTALLAEQFTPSEFMVKQGMTAAETGWFEIAFSERPVVLPTRVLLPGFLTNTLFYGAIWFGLFFAPGMTRRFIRTRRGRCPRCGYDLRGAFGDGCSECGWGRASSESADSREPTAEGSVQ